MRLLFWKYAVSLVLLMGPKNCTAISRPPTSSTTSTAESAIRATLGAVMASPVLVGVPHREPAGTPATELVRSVQRRAAAGPAADRLAAGRAAAPRRGSSH